MGTCIHYEPADFYKKLSEYPDAQVFARAYSLDEISGLVYMFYGDGDIHYLDRLFTTNEKQDYLINYNKFDLHASLYRKVMLDERLRENMELKMKNIYVLSDDKIVPVENNTHFNVGYLFLQKIYNELKLNDLMDYIKQKYRIQSDLNSIFSDIVYAMLIGDGQQEYLTSQKLLNYSGWTLKEGYQSLIQIGKESTAIQKYIFDAVERVYGHGHKVLVEDAFDIFTKGHNKIAHLKYLFDSRGIPLSYDNELDINPNSIQQYVLERYPHDIEIQLHKKQESKENYLLIKKVKKFKIDDSFESTYHDTVFYKQKDNEIKVYSKEMEEVDQTGCYIIETDLTDTNYVVKMAERSWKMSYYYSSYQLDVTRFPSDFNATDVYELYYILLFVSSTLVAILYYLLHYQYDRNDIVNTLKNMNVVNTEYGYVQQYENTELVSQLFKTFYDFEYIDE